MRSAPTLAALSSACAVFVANAFPALADQQIALTAAFSAAMAGLGAVMGEAFDQWRGK